MNQQAPRHYAPLSPAALAQFEPTHHHCVVAASLHLLFWRVHSRPTPSWTPSLIMRCGSHPCLVGAMRCVSGRGVKVQPQTTRRQSRPQSCQWAATYPYPSLPARVPCWRRRRECGQPHATRWLSCALLCLLRCFRSPVACGGFGNLPALMLRVGRDAPPTNCERAVRYFGDWCRMAIWHSSGCLALCCRPRARRLVRGGMHSSCTLLAPRAGAAHRRGAEPVDCSRTAGATQRATSQ